MADDEILENEEDLDESFDEDYQSEEDFAKDDGVFDKKSKTVDERAKKAYERKDYDFLNADLIDRSEYDEYVKNGKDKDKTVVVSDKRFSNGIDTGFTEAEQLKFGWRKVSSKAGIVVKDKILPQFDPEHKTLSVFKMIALPVTLPARGIWAGVKAIGKGFSLAGRWLGEKLGLVAPKNSSYELIGEKLEYEDSDRMPGVLTTDMKKNKVTPDMIYNSVINKTEFEHVGMGKQVPKNLINGNTKENYANALKESRDNLLAHVFNKGNPLGAYECVLDKKALKNGVYKFDDNATKKFLKELSDEKLEKFADKTVKKISKEYFKTHGGENKLREEMEKENSQVQEPVKENVQQEIKKERIEVPEAQDKEVKTVENITDKEHVNEIQAPENEQEKKL